MKSIIRRAKVEDSEALCDLLQQLGYASELAQVKQTLANNNQDSNSDVHVYELSGEIIGFISTIRFFYFPELQHVMRVTAMCVDQQHRGLSIGSKLLSFAEDLAASFGDAAVEATCSMSREQTHQFYLQNGYSKHSYKFVKHLAY